MRIHEIKCRSEYFNEVIAGNKNFTVRRKDRDYAVGDVLAVNEVTTEPDPCGTDEVDIYTGRCCLVKVSYILDDEAYCRYNHVIMGFQPCMMRAPKHDLSYIFSDGPACSGVPCYREVP